MAGNRPMIRIHVDGLPELKQAVDKLKEDVRKKVLGSAIAAGALVVLREARRLAPKDTGALREAIKQRRSRKYSKQDYEERHVGVFKVKGGKYANTRLNRRLGRVGKEYASAPPEYYWRFIELGTVKMKARSFLRPALERKKQAAVNKIKKRLAQKLEEVTRGPKNRPKKGSAT